MSVVSDVEVDVKNPQDALNEFWENVITKKPCKINNIFPSGLYSTLLSSQRRPGPAKGRNAAESYEAAAKECRARVEQIVRECERTNEKFTDPDFDIESDFGHGNCLDGLLSSYDDPLPPKSNISPAQLGEALATLTDSGILNSSTITIHPRVAAQILAPRESADSTRPGSVHRIDWIFDKPSFTVDSYSSSDVKQGANGDCWFIAAVATLCSNVKLMEKVCVATDEKCQQCGVYGFMFYRDGEWIWTVVDDNLYIKYPDFDAYGDEYDPTGIKETRHKKRHQTGSDALFFGSCTDQNETWLPLLEKAYAKVHGDYDAIEGGTSGEAVEDLTGGITTIIKTNRILSKLRLWKELLQVNQTFLFSASSPSWYGDDSDARQGLALGHAYSIIKAVEVEDKEGKEHRLVLIRNPWGKRFDAGMGEWNGAWSDGSKEWTPYWMEKLDHRFGDDGMFWMSYDDLCKRFYKLDRTRLFDDEWTVVQTWTSMSIAWVTSYLNTKFVVEIKKAGPTVFVLCQLDGRYFRGLEGKYTFKLSFVLQDENAPTGDHIVRARGTWFGDRSVSAEVELKPGRYEVVPEIIAERDDDAPDVLEVVTKVEGRNPQKLRQIGANYDTANAKGVVQVTPEEKKKKEERAKAAEEKKRKEREEADREKTEFEEWKKERKERKEREEKEKVEKEKAEKMKTEKPNSEQETNKQEKTEQANIEKEKTSIEDKSAGTKGDEPGQVAEHAKVGTSEDKTTQGPQQPSTDNKDGAVDDLEDKGSTAHPPAGDPAPSSPSTARGPISPRPSQPPASAYGGVPHSYAPGDSSPQPKSPTKTSAAPDEVKKWNAVCVLGLRVYSQDAEVSIKLVKPKNAEEAVLPDVDGTTQVGAITT